MTALLAGKVALVTGSSMGIGAGIAMEFARAGADVCLNYVGNREPAQQVMKQIGALGRKAIAVATDVASREQVEQMVAQCERELGPVDILVTNAITSVRDSLLETKFEDLQRTVGVGLYGVFHCMQVVARSMVARGARGSIIHLTSPHAVTPFKGAIDYNIAKAGSHHLALSAANELMWHGIRVNLIQPGWTVTPGETKFYTEEQLHSFGDRMPLGRMEYPPDLGKAAVYLASDMSDYVAGAVLRVDGGQFIEGGPSWESKARHE